MNIVGVSFSYSDNSMNYRGLTLMDHHIGFSDIIKLDLPVCNSNKADGIVPPKVKNFDERLEKAMFLFLQYQNTLVTMHMVLRM